MDEQADKSGRGRKQIATTAEQNQAADALQLNLGKDEYQVLGGEALLNGVRDGHSTVETSNGGPARVSSEKSNSQDSTTFVKKREMKQAAKEGLTNASLAVQNSGKSRTKSKFLFSNRSSRP